MYNSFTIKSLIISVLTLLISSSYSSSRYHLLRHQLIGTGETQMVELLKRVQIHHWALSIENDLGLDHVYELDIGMSPGTKLRSNNLTFIDFVESRKTRKQNYYTYLGRSDDNISHSSVIKELDSLIKNQDPAGYDALTNNCQDLVLALCRKLDGCQHEKLQNRLQGKKIAILGKKLLGNLIG